MHVVAARFRTVASASAALQSIRSNVAVAPGDAGIRPLGSTRYDEPTGDFLLAGRFAEEDVARVVEIVTAEGGRVIERRQELTKSALADVSTGAQARLASNPPWSASWTPVRHQGRPAERQRSRPGRWPRRPAALLRGRAGRAHRFR